MHIRNRTRLTITLALTGVGAALSCWATLEIALRWSPVDPEPYLRLDPSPILLDRHGALLQAALNTEDAWCFPKRVDAHSRYLIEATIAVEDQRFWSHRGVDPLAVFRAGIQNTSELRVTSGASTLSMQLTKMHAPQERTIAGKARQAWNAMRLERASTKSEILATYLNRAPYGYNLIGAEAAARRYFGKSSRELTIREAALLAALPKAPARLDPLRHPEAARDRRNFVLARMRDESFITDQQYREAARSPLEARWHAMPSAAPHLAMHLAPYSQVQTTIDAKTQDHTRELTTYFLKQYDGKISNAAAVVIEVETSTILAYSGSADFFRSDGGQIDLARAVRSPGSALKPFVYAYAMQHDLVYPSEMLLDDVLDYGDYSPANFDGAFNGLITAADALRYSLNVPAVQLLERSGVSNVHATLQQLGLTTLDRAPSHYGLGLTLGNCGVRLDELAAAYAALANNGVYRSPQVVKDADAGLPKPVFDAAVAATILDLLRQPLPRELPHSLVQRHRALAPVAWKTGTSTGHRDAWAFVFNRQYVVGVWMGNPDGRPAEQLVGADAALPLAGALFRRLPAKDKPAWPELTQTHRMVLVCADSGLPRSTACDASIEVRLPRSMYTARRCDVHRSQITLAESIRRWPADARHWNLASIQNPIPLRGNAGHIQAALRITSPANDAEYVLTGKPSGDRIRLQASLEIDQQVHWYSNGHYLGMSDASTPQYLDLASGEHEIACMVENGATDSIRITVYDPRGGPGHPPGDPL